MSSIFTMRSYTYRLRAEAAVKSKAKAWNKLFLPSLKSPHQFSSSVTCSGSRACIKPFHHSFSLKAQTLQSFLYLLLLFRPPQRDSAPVSGYPDSTVTARTKESAPYLTSSRLRSTWRHKERVSQKNHVLDRHQFHTGLCFSWKVWIFLFTRR